MKTNITTDMGNNETATRGIVENNDGTFTALTYTKSKDFKTRNGAALWFARQAWVMVDHESTNHGAFTVVRMGDRTTRLVGRLGKAEAVLNALHQWGK